MLYSYYSTNGSGAKQMRANCPDANRWPVPVAEDLN